MSSICRVFISNSESLRSFYWFEYSEDNSIYFGSSNGKNFRIGYAGTWKSSATEATRVEPIREGRPMTADELGKKHSVHGSGVVIEPTLANGCRERYKISPPRDGFSTLPLIAVLPMHPTSYPISNKTPKPTDIVIEVGASPSVPFGSMFYLNQTEELEPPPILGAKSYYETFATTFVPFGICRLCVSIYADSSHMRHWSRLEGSIRALPEQSGGNPNWPFFSNVIPG